MSLTNFQVFCRENWSLEPNQCPIFIKLMQEDIKNNTSQTSKKTSIFLAIGKAKFRFFAQYFENSTAKLKTSKDFDDTGSLRTKIVEIITSEYLDKQITVVNMISRRIITNSISVHHFLTNTKDLNHISVFCDFPKNWCAEIDRALFTPLKLGWIIREHVYDNFVLQLDKQSYADKTNIRDYCFMAIGKNSHFFETHQGTHEIASNFLKSIKQIANFKTNILGTLNPESTPLIGVLDMISRRMFLSSSAQVGLKGCDPIIINKPENWEKAITAIFDRTPFSEE